MNEIHSVDFDRFGVNVLSDEERGTIVLQFDAGEYEARVIGPILKSIQRRFGQGIRGHLSRWMTGAREVLLVTSHAQPHPDQPDVILLEMAVKEGERMDTALAALVDFFRHQPGYRRTLGPPLDPDAPHGPIRSGRCFQSSRGLVETLHRGSTPEGTAEVIVSRAGGTHAFLGRGIK